MKNIADYQAGKYSTEPYRMVESGIYSKDGGYVTSLSFEQEPEYGEGENSAMISQYPLEDILDEFMVYVSDFYDVENLAGRTKCLLEFSSDDIADVQSLRSIIGKTVRIEDGRLIIQ